MRKQKILGIVSLAIILSGLALPVFGMYSKNYRISEDSLDFGKIQEGADKYQSTSLTSSVSKSDDSRQIPLAIFLSVLAGLVVSGIALIKRIKIGIKNSGND